MYRSIATGEAVFFRYIEAMDHAWENAVTFFNNNYSLVETYISFRNGLIGKEELKAFISTFCINKELTDYFHIRCYNMTGSEHAVSNIRRIII